MHLDVTSDLHAVLFVRNVERAATFYGRVLGAGIAHVDAGVAELDVGGRRLILHAMPPHLVDSTEPPPQPVRRSDVAIKLSFGVASLTRAREVAPAVGGSIDAVEREFTYAGRRYIDAVDPEGNVIQLHEATS